MLNILVISDDAEKIYSMLRSRSFISQRKCPKQNGDSQACDMVFLDLDNEGWQQKLIELRQRMPVIAFSTPDVKVAVEAMKLGASDFFDKPLTLSRIDDVIKGYRKKILDHASGFDEIIGISMPMQNVFGLIKKAAVSESNVLITGASGTGKELVARAIHRWSPRRGRAFMTINCSAIPDTLLESELFGFEKGAFTGANYTKKGLLELADGGTVFFDEVGDVSPLFQVKILRVIQENEIMRIGGSRPLKIDVRIIAATNRNLKVDCQKGKFREDLFYRLNVIHIHLPALRDKMEDVPLLAAHFVKKYAQKRKDFLIKGISDEALNLLLNYAYPGNTRELENIVERAISFANSPVIMPSDLPFNLSHAAPRRSASNKNLKNAIENFEREQIWSALQKSRGNISKAADELGIYRQQLQRKIRKLKIAT